MYEFPKAIRINVDFIEAQAGKIEKLEISKYLSTGRYLGQLESTFIKSKKGKKYQRTILQ